jgi:hypothetical protein
MPRLLLIMIFINQTVWAQNDWAEYGYFGKLKRMELNRITITKGESHTTNITQIFNELGNVDTLITKSFFSFEMSNYSIRVYEFSNNRKNGWKEYNGIYELRAYATITWNGDSSYSEKTFNSDSTCKSETIYYLKPNFNSYKIVEYEADENCAMKLISTVLLNRPNFGPAVSMQLTLGNNKNPNETIYTIIGKDEYKNPRKTLAINGKTEIRSFRKYIYY